MIPDSFHTIASASEGFYSERGSKFISFAFPVSSEDEIKGHIAVLKKKYYDARHHVYAFILGGDQSFYRASDDGEPSNSSGPPVLGQIRSMGLTNVLIVVVRYFGGTKLGVSGLINAYRSAARDALERSEIIEETIKITHLCEFAYDEINFVMKCVRDYDAIIKEQNFQESCRLIFAVRLSLSEQLLNVLMQNHKIKITVGYE